MWSTVFRNWRSICGSALAITLLMSVAVVSSWAANTKVGFVDLQKAISGTKEWKREFIAFKTGFQKEKVAIAEKEKKIKQMLQELNKQSFVLDPDLKKRKEEKFLKQKREFERYVQDMNEDFSKKEKEVTSKIVEKMVKIIKKVGKEKKFTMVLEKKALLYYNPANDLTNTAIKIYDRKYK